MKLGVLEWALMGLEVKIPQAFFPERSVQIDSRMDMFPLLT